MPDSPILTNNDLALALYLELLGPLPPKKDLPSLIIVQHVVPNSLPLFAALAEKFEIAAIIPKPKSIHGSTREKLQERRLTVLDLDRQELNSIVDEDHSLPLSNDRRFAILDIGGYFSQCCFKFSELYGERFCGIVEDTENGHQKYARAYVDRKETMHPIFSVARSPLKEPEDFLVGQSIVYSTESILRDNYSLLLNRQVLVIGYGKIGRSIATSLAVRNVNVWVYDEDPIKQAQAMSHGFLVPEREFALKNAGLIFGATGNQSMSFKDFHMLKKFAFVASVTSADDEFDIQGLNKAYRVAKEADSDISVYQDKKSDRLFYLIRNGDAVNFVHSNALGVYIYLVACEIIWCLKKMINMPSGSTYGEILQLSTEERRLIATAWRKQFYGQVFSK